MMEALSLVIFAGVMYFCLVVAPTVMECVKLEDCKKAFVKHAQSE